MLSLQADNDPQEEAAEAIARTIGKAGMSTPASLALQVFKPLAWVSGQMLWVLQPFAGALGIRSRRDTFSVANLASFLERDGNVDALIRQLDDDNRRAEP
ncbi:MAG TPA: hypothetical protein VEW94_02135 [Chloroflexia bacterium]|nr:hypothetical protein [Chloroflexia bacterium]